MADEVKFIVSAEDKASPTLEKVKGGFSSLQQNFAQMGLGFAAGGAAIGLVVKGWVDAASEAEKSQKQLEHAVIDVSHGTREQLKAMEDLSAVIQKKGVLDDDAVKTGLAQLSTFGLSTDAVHDLGQSMADLAVNQYGVGASGDQLTASANMISKAMRGEFGMLEKSGIRFSEAQQHAIKFGTEMEKVAALNEGFAQNLKYTNEVALGTFEGQMANLTNRFGDFQETLGNAVIPMIQLLGDWLGQAVTWLENLDPNIVNAVAQGVAFAGAFAAITGAVMLFIAALNPVTIAIAAVAVAFTLWTLYGQQVIDFFKKFGIDFGAIWEGVKKAVDEAWQWIVTTIIPKVQKFVDDLKARIAPMIQYIQEHWDTISAIFNFAFQTISLAFEIFWQGIQAAFSIAWEVLTGAIKLGLSLLQGDWTGAWNAIKEMFMGVWNAISGFLDGVLKAIVSKLGGNWDQIKTDLGSFIDSVTTSWNNFWNGLKGVVDSVVGTIKGVISSLLNTINGAIDALKSLLNLGQKAGGVSMAKGVAGHNAAGGSVYAGRTYMVGENGPEPFTPAVNGYITPNHKAGGGSVTQTVILNFLGPVSSKEIAEEYAEIVLGKLKLSTQVI